MKKLGNGKRFEAVWLSRWPDREFFTRPWLETFCHGCDLVTLNSWIVKLTRYRLIGPPGSGNLKAFYWLGVCQHCGAVHWMQTPASLTR